MRGVTLWIQGFEIYTKYFVSIKLSTIFFQKIKAWLNLPTNFATFVSSLRFFCSYRTLHKILENAKYINSALLLARPVVHTRSRLKRYERTKAFISDESLLFLLFLVPHTSSVRWAPPPFLSIFIRLAFSHRLFRIPLCCVAKYEKTVADQGKQPLEGIKYFLIVLRVAGSLSL